MKNNKTDTSINLGNDKLAKELLLNLFQFLFLELSFRDLAENTGIQLLVVIAKLIEDLVYKVVNLIIILLIQNWQCVSSNRALERERKINEKS